MALLTHEKFETRYGDIVRRLFAIDQETWTAEGLPNLIFRRPLDWPVIPLPDSLEGMCRYADEQRNLENWLDRHEGELFYDSAVPSLYRWFFEREARRILWAPTVETLARHGGGSAAVFELRKGLRRIDVDESSDEGSYYVYPYDWSDVEKTLAREPDTWALEDWHAAEIRIDGGLPLDFGDWQYGMGDFICLIDDTADWALHSWGECNICYLTAEPALMERVLDAVGGPETVGMFFSIECGMTYEFMDSLEQDLEFFRKPPFVEMPLRVVRTLDEHLEAHPWLDKAFADL